MVKKIATSEYGGAFGFTKNIYACVHEYNVGYRNRRRRKEHTHNRDSFIWDDTDSEVSIELNESNYALNETEPRPASVPIHKSKHDKFNKTYKAKKVTLANQEQHKQLVEQLEKTLTVSPSQEILKKKTKKRIEPHTPPPSLQTPPAEARTYKLADRQIQTPDWSKINLQETFPIRKNTKSDSKTTKGSKSSKGKRQVTLKDSPSNLRPHTAPQSHHRKKADVSESLSKAFVLFGYGDKELDTTLKRTWNVRSPVDVYPSALRAQQRQHISMQIVAEEEKAPPEQKQHRALFNNFDFKMGRETAAWETEYRRHFKGYEKAVYEREFEAAKTIRRPKSPFNATI